jgi:hypothetical protein
MHHNLIVGILVFSLASLGCSSGGGDGPAPEDTPPTLQETLATLQSCVAPDLEQVAALLQLLEELSSGEALPEDLEISINLLAGGINFEYPVDLDDDGEPESTLSGLLSFRDAEGNATIPFDLNNLPETLEDALGQLDNGESVRVAYNVKSNDDSIEGNGVISVLFAEGEVDGVSGDGSLQSDACTFGFDLGTLKLEDLLAEYPIADVTFSVEVDGEAADGRIELDGTDTATAFFNGFEFDIDLDDLRAPIAPPEPDEPAEGPEAPNGA